MTIGPEPITRMWRRSSRRGIRLLSEACGTPAPGRTNERASQCDSSVLQKTGETVEEICGVVGSGGGLRVVLHREGAAVHQPHALHGAVVGAGVADLGGAERSVEALTGLALEREAVVLRGDGDPARRVVHNRHVDAAVPELHLVGLQTQCAAEDLVAEADPEQR